MSSAVKAGYYLLTNNVPLTAVVPAASIMAGVIPEGTPAPCIGLVHVSTVRRHSIPGSATEFCTSRIQVTVHAATYQALHDALQLVLAALPRSRGTVAGVNVDSILSDIEGPDFHDEESGVYMRSRDYIVKFSE